MVVVEVVTEDVLEKGLKGRTYIRTHLTSK